MPRKKLLLILGAGSSQPVRFPSVADLDAAMLDWSTAWTAGFPGVENYYAILSSKLLEYRNARAHPTDLLSAPMINFETILGQMVALATWVTPPPWGNCLRQCVGPGLVGLTFARGVVHDRFGQRISVNNQLVDLLSRLARHMREKSIEFALTPPTAFPNYRDLLASLQAEFEVGLYNLNYDTAAVAALPSSYCGFSSSGSFEPDMVHARKEWDFIYHLHGSVHHDIEDSLDYRIAWRRDLSGNFDDGRMGTSTLYGTNQNSFPKTTLIAGGFKLDQMLQEPFHSFYASLVRHAWEADAILLGGYGFGDLHVNRALSSRLSRLGRPPTMILDYANDSTSSMGGWRTDHWTHGLFDAARAAIEDFRVPGASSPTPMTEIKAAAAFEVNSKTAVWYGGFPEAVARKSAIIEWLDGGADSLLGPT